MRPVEALGEQIEDLWRKVSYSEEAFGEIAANALASFEGSADFFRDVTAWGLGDHSIPFQFDVEATFGQPPICIYVNPLQTFYIQALVWLDSTTAVHQHGFCGAFKVVAGQSMHVRYSFDETDRVNSRMVFGSIKYLGAEVLSLGDVRKIERGNSFIHSAFHLERPSITLVVRTPGDATTGPQYNYLRPWLAIDSFYESPRLQRNLQILTAIKDVDRARYVDTLASLIEKADVYTTYRYVRHCYESAPAAADRARITTLVRTIHGERGEKLVVCLDEVARDGFLIDKRKILRDPDHRFFVALLLNVPSRAGILELIQRRYPGDPIDHVARWIDELSNGDDALLSPLDESTRYVLKSMVRGSTLEHVVEDLHREYEAEEVIAQLDTIKQLYDQLRASSAFRPVLRA
jgi:hypothetical protein